jgi:uncharacterized protein
MIIELTYQLLKSEYKDRIGNLTIKDIRIGLFLTAVRLSDDSYGIASTLANELRDRTKRKRDFSDFSPLKIKGQKVNTLFETSDESDVILTLKTAVLNAISSKIISSGNYKIFENCDPIDLIDLSLQKTITIVGAFHSYIQKISETKNRLYVLELNEDALTSEEKQFYVPAKEYKNVLPESDIVIITGLTLVNKTIDALLSSLRKETMVIVTGPSSSIIPDILFANNVNIIGATRITRPDILFDLVAEAGAGYHLFEYCAQKICILRNDEKRIKREMD